jgi:hypothetical protein
MTHSKFLPIILAAFCCLALQFQASGANAQSFPGVPGSPASEIFPDASLQPGNAYMSDSLCEPIPAICLFSCKTEILSFIAPVTR